MNKNLLIGSGIGLACILAAVAGVLYMQRGAHLDLPGKVLKVRTAPLDDNASIAIVDFRITNSSDYPAVVRAVTVTDEEKSGNRLTGQTISDLDAKRVFEALPLLGQKYNQSLMLRDRIPAHAAWDRMIAARFEVAEGKLQERKRLIVTVEEVDGRTFDIPEN